MTNIEKSICDMALNCLKNHHNCDTQCNYYYGNCTTYSGHPPYEWSIREIANIASFMENIITHMKDDDTNE